MATISQSIICAVYQYTYILHGLQLYIYTLNVILYFMRCVTYWHFRIQDFSKKNQSELCAIGNTNWILFSSFHLQLYTIISVLAMNEVIFLNSCLQPWSLVVRAVSCSHTSFLMASDRVHLWIAWSVVWSSWPHGYVEEGTRIKCSQLKFDQAIII